MTSNTYITGNKCLTIKRTFQSGKQFFSSISAMDDQYNNIYFSIHNSIKRAGRKTNRYQFPQVKV